MRRKSGGAGRRRTPTLFMLAVNTRARSSRGGIIRLWCGGGIKRAASPGKAKTRRQQRHTHARRKYTARGRDAASTKPWYGRIICYFQTIAELLGMLLFKRLKIWGSRICVTAAEAPQTGRSQAAFSRSTAGPGTR